MPLADLGFSATQERVYRALVEDAAADVTELARRTGLDAEDVRAALCALTGLGLLRERDGGPELLNPAVALGLLIEQREDELLAGYRRVAQTRAEAADLDARYKRGVVPPAVAGVQRLDGIAAVREQLGELSFYHRHSVYSIQTGGPMDSAALDASRPLDTRTLRRNLRLRSIYHESALEDELTRAYMHEMVGRGAQIRVVSSRPDRMLLIDEEVAVVPIDPRHSARGAVVVRQPALVSGFLELFNRVWDESRDVPWAADAAAPAFVVDDGDRQVLRLLASGCTDETAAREVGVSVRHLRRQIARLMMELGAKSRFEAGVAAARRGWI